MFHTICISVALTAASLALASPSLAQSQTNDSQADERLLIVNGNTHRVIYDDGRDDLFCVTRRYIAGYTYWGHPIYRRTMRCR